MKNEQHPLITLYGEEVFDLAYEKIQDLARNSNFTFDGEYVKLGTSFVQIKAQEIVDGKKKKRSLDDLVSESFGEAAIYKFQCK